MTLPEEQSPVWIDAETTVAGRPSDHQMELRLWLRLFSCSRLIETQSGASARIAHPVGRALAPLRFTG